MRSDLEVVGADAPRKLSYSIYSYGRLAAALSIFAVICAIFGYQFDHYFRNNLAESATYSLLCSQEDVLRGSVINSIIYSPKHLDSDAINKSVQSYDYFNYGFKTNWIVNVGPYQAAVLPPGAVTPDYSVQARKYAGAKPGRHIVRKVIIGGRNYDECLSVYPLVLPKLISFSGQRALYTILWPAEEFEGVKQKILQHTSDTMANYAIFAAILGTVLVVIGGALFIQNTLVSKHLQILRDDVEKVALGRESRLTGDYPRELSGLADIVNSALDSNERSLSGTRTLITRIAHDVNNKLQSLIGVLPKEGQNVAIIRRLVSDIKSMIERYRQLSRVSTIDGSASWQRRVFDLASLAFDMVQLQRLDIQNQKIRYAIQINDQPLDLHAPFNPAFAISVSSMAEGDVEIVLANLLSNATKYGNGQVLLDIRTTEAAVELTVHDNGAGVGEEEQSNIFKDGYRAEVDQDKPGSGYGLGIVKMLCDLAGAKISVGPSPLGGAAFQLLLLIDNIPR